MIGTNWDITAQKQAEEALRSQTALLEAQSEATLDGILVVDGNGRRSFTNQQILKLFAVPPAILADPDDAALLKHVVSLTKDPAGFLSKVTDLYDHPEESSRDEIEFKSGMVLDRYSAPVLGQDGHNYGRIWTFRDITKRRRAEAALRESEARLRVITDSAQDAILMLNPEGFVSYWNPAAERILGYTSEEAIGQNLHSLVVPERYRAAHHAAFPAFRQTGQGAAVGKTLDLEARRKDGREISVQVSLSAIQINGGWYSVGLMRDTTAQKAAEAALHESEANFRTFFESFLAFQ
jgi:PAS domain S-box-containing protein